MGWLHQRRETTTHRSLSIRDGWQQEVDNLGLGAGNGSSHHWARFYRHFCKRLHLHVFLNSRWTIPICRNFFRRLLLFPSKEQVARFHTKRLRARSEMHCSGNFGQNRRFGWRWHDCALPRWWQFLPSVVENPNFRFGKRPLNFKRRNSTSFCNG